MHTLSLKETMGRLNAEALVMAQEGLTAGHSETDIMTTLRTHLAMPNFPGNLLAVRMTDLAKVTAAELPAAMLPARRLLLAALQAEVDALEPRYKERLANSHK